MLLWFLVIATMGCYQHTRVEHAGHQNALRGTLMVRCDGLTNAFTKDIKLRASA